METRIVEKPAFRLVGRAARVPAVAEGVNRHVRDHVASIPAEELERLAALSDGEPAGLLAVTSGLDADGPGGAELDYLHGVATGPRPDAGELEGLDVLEVPALTWAVFRISGPCPQPRQETWAAAASPWFPTHPWRLAKGPEIVAVLEHSDDLTVATCEVWLPVESV